jgi:hypothetical protein
MMVSVFLDYLRQISFGGSLFFERIVVRFSTKASNFYRVRLDCFHSRKWKVKTSKSSYFQNTKSVVDWQRFFEILTVPSVFEGSNGGEKASVTPTLWISHRHPIVQEQSERRPPSEKSRTDVNGESVSPLENELVTWIFPEKVSGNSQGWSRTPSLQIWLRAQSKIYLSWYDIENQDTPC